MEFFNANQRRGNLKIHVEGLEKIKMERDTLLQNLKQQDNKY